MSKRFTPKLVCTQGNDIRLSQKGETIFDNKLLFNSCGRLKGLASANTIAKYYIDLGVRDAARKNHENLLDISINVGEVFDRYYETDIIAPKKKRTANASDARRLITKNDKIHIKALIINVYQSAKPTSINFCRVLLQRFVDKTYPNVGLVISDAYTHEYMKQNVLCQYRSNGTDLRRLVKADTFTCDKMFA